MKFRCPTRIVDTHSFSTTESLLYEKTNAEIKTKLSLFHIQDRNGLSQVTTPPTTKPNKSEMDFQMKTVINEKCLFRF